MDKESVLKLAQLARIKVSDEEAEKLSHEFEGILKYVGEVKNAAGSATPEYALKNVMRPDGEGHESGIYTETLLKAAPARQGDYIKVKKIL